MAYITEIDTAKAEALEGVVAVITKRAGRVLHTGRRGIRAQPVRPQADEPEGPPVGDRVAAVSPGTRSPEGGSDRVYTKCSSRCSPSRGDGRGQACTTRSSIRRRYPRLDEYNKDADPRDGKVIYQFHSTGTSPESQARHGRSGMSSRVQGSGSRDRTHLPDQSDPVLPWAHLCYARIDGGRLVVTPRHRFLHVRIVAGVRIPSTRCDDQGRVGSGYGSSGHPRRDRQVCDG